MYFSCIHQSLKLQLKKLTTITFLFNSLCPRNISGKNYPNIRYLSYFICALIDEVFETVAILGEFRYFTDVFLLPFQSYTLKEIFSKDKCVMLAIQLKDTCFSKYYLKIHINLKCKKQESSVSRKREITGNKTGFQRKIKNLVPYCILKFLCMKSISMYC